MTNAGPLPRVGYASRTARDERPLGCARTSRV